MEKTDSVTTHHRFYSLRRSDPQEVVLDKRLENLGLRVAQLDPYPLSFLCAMLMKTGIEASALTVLGLVLAAISVAAWRWRLQIFAILAVRKSLLAFIAGEPSRQAMSIKPGLAAISDAWNQLMDESEQLRSQVSGQRAAETLLASDRTGSELKAACDVMPQGMVLIDDHLKIKLANAAAAVFLGMDRESLIGKQVTEAVKDQQLEETIRAVGTGAVRRLATVELNRNDHDRGEGILRFSVRPVRPSDSCAAAIFIEDVTSQRVAENANQTFITEAIHQLRQPLTNIRLYTETLMEPGEQDAELRSECLQVVDRSSRHLGRLVSDMLAVVGDRRGADRR